MAMDYRTALEILHLNEGYTRDELNNAVKREMTKYHTDTHPDDKLALQKSQEIGEAKAILKERLQGRTSYTKEEYNYTYNSNYQKQTSKTNYNIVINTFKSNLYTSYILYSFDSHYSKINDKEFLDMVKKIMNLIEEFENRAKEMNSLEEINNLYVICNTLIKQRIDEYISHFFKSNKIPYKYDIENGVFEAYDKRIINYNCFNVYLTLKIIKDKKDINLAIIRAIKFGVAVGIGTNLIINGIRFIVNSNRDKDVEETIEIEENIESHLENNGDEYTLNLKK